MSPEPIRPLSRLYLIPALLALVLGGVTLGAHLRQPSIPAFPGKGCIVTAFAGPDTLHLPSPHLELQACTHISETLFYLNFLAAPDAAPVPLFEASGPEDPRRWARHLHILWVARDTIQVGFDREVRFEGRLDSYDAVMVRYVPLADDGT
jgi:hypothetical protein